MRNKKTFGAIEYTVSSFYSISELVKVGYETYLRDHSCRPRHDKSVPVMFRRRSALLQRVLSSPPASEGTSLRVCGIISCMGRSHPTQLTDHSPELSRIPSYFNQRSSLTHRHDLKPMSIEQEEDPGTQSRGAAQTLRPSFSDAPSLSCGSHHY